MVENIQMSRASIEFLSNIDQALAVDGWDLPDIQLYRSGYMFLASKEREETMRKNHVIQR